MDKKYLTISITTAIIGFLATKLYRPYIYSHHIFDFWLADTIGSLVCVLASCTFIWSYKYYSTVQKNNLIMMAAFIYSAFWEGCTAILTNHIDWPDIVAVWISAAFTYLVKEHVDKLVKSSL